jgi:hypothetical protein
MFLRRVLFLLPLILAGCAADSTSPLLQRVRVIQADGSLTKPLTDKDLSPFQQLLRDRLPPEPPQPTSIFALEADVPDGDGTEGGYLAIVRSDSSIVLRYYEQEDHLPRADRFYYRPLSPPEATEFEVFVKAHPLADLRRVHPAAAAPESVASQPSDGASAAAPPVATPAPAPDPATTQTQPDATAGEPPIMFRLTDARPDRTETLVVRSPGKDDHPVIDLLHMLARFRDAAPFAGRYFQPIPLTARALYADPHRRVLYVWHEGDDLRIAVSVPPPPEQAVPEESQERWLAFKDGQWQPSSPPSETASEAATGPAAELAPAMASAAQSATAPATEPEVALDPFAHLDLTPYLFPDRSLPQVERWWTEPNRKSTTVYHYVPISKEAGATLGFVVPAFEFDDEHFAVDAARGMLYVIHDGQLFSLPIPPAALKPQENP